MICVGDIISALGFIISGLGTYQQCVGNLSSVHWGLIIGAMGTDDIHRRIVHPPMH